MKEKLSRDNDDWKRVDPNIKRALDSAEGVPTIDLQALPLDTIFEFETSSGSIYRIKKIEETISDGRLPKYLVLYGSPRYFSSPREVYIHGATFGTPMIQPDVIKDGMQVEMAFVEPDTNGRILTTSRATNLRIVSAPEKQN